MKFFSAKIVPALLCCIVICVTPQFAQKVKKPKKTASAAPPVAAPIAAMPPIEEKETFLENPFQLGMFLQDSNGDSIADLVCGHIIVSENPTAADNAAAANLAARIGYETSAMTLPIVVQGTVQADASCKGYTPNIWIGANALSSTNATAVSSITSSLALGQGAVVVVDGGIAIVGPDPLGLLNAANAYAARAPFLWNVPGDKVLSLAKNVNTTLAKAGSKATVELRALVISQNTQGVSRAILKLQGATDPIAIQKILHPDDGPPVQLGAAREIEVLVGDTPLVFTGSAGSARPVALPAMPEAAEGDEKSLDLARLYTVKGLLTGSTKKPIPSGTSAKLYTVAGKAGIAIANLAARLGLETVGITLPIAMPDAGLTSAQVQGTSVVAEGSPAAEHLKDVLAAKGGVDFDKLAPGSAKAAGSQSTELVPLSTGEGELRIVEHGFGKKDAILVRGDQSGASSALEYAAQHLPYLWEPNKRYASVEEIRDDLRRFFAQRSDVGQAASALYHLDRWSEKLAKEHAGSFTSIHAEIDVGEADPKLKEFAAKLLTARLHPVKLEVVTGNLHAGVKCCNGEVPQHLQSDVMPFEPAEPTFSEDLTFEWEGKRLLAAATKAASSLPAGQHFKIQAGVSESPEQRQKLTDQLQKLLSAAGVKSADVEVLCSY